MSIITRNKTSSRQGRHNSKPARTIIYNAQMLAGPELEHVTRGRLEICGKLIASVSRTSKDGQDSLPEGRDCALLDGSGLLIIPAFVNAHTHIGDSMGKDIGASLGLDERVNPVFGIKKNILEKTPPEQIKAFMRFSAISMLKNGIVNFADFREDGRRGVMLLKEALKGLPIRAVVLGRSQHGYDQVQPQERQSDARNVDSASELQPASTAGIKGSQGAPEAGRIDNEITDLLDDADGLGLSGANEHSDSALSRYQSLVHQAVSRRAKSTQGMREKPLVAIHAAESTEAVNTSKALTGKTEVERILRALEPDILVHLTKATEQELASIAARGIGVVVCPRANGVLGVGFPPVSLMLELGCTVALGTDNVMLNSPDMFREMDYVWKACRALDSRKARTGMLEPRQVLKMATVNGGKVLGVNTGCIAPGMSADLLFIDVNHIDISPMHDPYAAIVHRAGPDCIKGVMASGEFVGLIPSNK